MHPLVYAYLGVGLAFAILASLFSRHKNRDDLGVFIWITFAWVWIVPRALYRACREVVDERDVR